MSVPSQILKKGGKQYGVYVDLLWGELADTQKQLTPKITLNSLNWGKVGLTWQDPQEVCKAVISLV